MAGNRVLSAVRSALRIATGRHVPLSASFEEVELAEREFYVGYLREDMTVFDVGAGTGELSSLFARLTPSGIVHAFEPGSESHAELATRIAEEGLQNVIIRNVAVSDAVRTVRLHCYAGPHRSWSSMAIRPLANYGIDVSSSHTEDVAATTIDEYCRREGVNDIGLLKIDVEGAELQVLRGAARMLSAKRIRCVSFEFGQTTYDMGNTPEALEELLRGYDYTLRSVIPTDPLFPGRASVLTARYAMHLAFPR